MVKDRPKRRADKKKRFYCFVDETGQDTDGKFFLVAIVLKETKTLDVVEKQLEKAESKSGKGKTKWNKAPFEARKDYLLQVANLKGLRRAIFYSAYQNSKEYTPLVSLTIAKAVFAKREKNYDVRIVIDGLTKREMEKVRKELKKLTIKYRKIRGMKDEQSVFLRLADAIAGFMRDFHEKQNYTKSIISKFRKANIILEV